MNETFFYIADSKPSGYIQGGKVIEGIVVEFFQIISTGELVMGSVITYPPLSFEGVYDPKIWHVHKISEDKYRAIVQLGNKYEPEFS